ncbi:MAG: T9SS type A sorting domain-containing protein [Flavobacterium sp.]
MDINGRIVKQVSSSTSLTSINVSDLNSGIYFVNIETDEGKSTKKIIKN